MVISLSSPVDSFVSELDEIESIFYVCRGQRSVSYRNYSYVPAEDGCLVSLWDAWARFLRDLVLTCAGGSTEGLAGVQYVPTTARNESQALTDMFSHRRGNNFNIVHGEPRWFDPVNLTSIVSFLGLANANTIVAAVGASSVTLGALSVANPLDEIRTCRNFIAHKLPPALADVVSYAQGPFLGMSDHLRSLRSGVETFSEWKDCLVAIADAAAQ